MEEKRKRGRPKGYPKTGGRQLGSLNKSTIATIGMNKKDLEAYGMSPVFTRDFASIKPIQRVHGLLHLMAYLIPKAKA